MIALTELLRAWLEEHPDQIEWAVGLIDEYMKVYKEMREKSRTGADLAAMDEVDKLIEIGVKGVPLGSKISCGKGCSHCCYTKVSITEDEAEVLAMTAHFSKIDIDTFLLDRQASVKGGHFYQQQFKNRKCVFLAADGTCQVYPMRPAA